MVATRSLAVLCFRCLAVPLAATAYVAPRPRTPATVAAATDSLSWNATVSLASTCSLEANTDGGRVGADDPPKFRVRLHPSEPCLVVGCLDDSRRYHDATFRLRWKFPEGEERGGEAVEGIEWRGGKRFYRRDREGFACALPAMEAAELREGGIPQGASLEAEVVIHGSGPPAEGGADERGDDDGAGPYPWLPRPWRAPGHGYRQEESEVDDEESWLETALAAARFKDPRAPSPADPPSTADPPSAPRHRGLRVGSVVIPLLTTRARGVLPELLKPADVLVSTLFSATVLGGSWVNVPRILMNDHRSMWERGCYPGVEYRVTRIVDGEGQERFYHEEGTDYEVRPVYPLGPILEREWPARINEGEIPSLISPLQYNLATAVGALSASAGILVSFFFASLIVSLFFIPSRSMEPSLNVGDVLLVEKVTPRLPFARYKRGDVVMFRPPSALRDLVERNGGSLGRRDLFVKRVGAVAGDVVEVKADGEVTVTSGKIGENVRSSRRNLCDAEPLGLIRKYVKPGVTIVPRGRVMLLGDCSSVSVDGRVWGTLNVDDIVGRPVVRTWPPFKPSGIPSLPTVGNPWSD